MTPRELIGFLWPLSIVTQLLFWAAINESWLKRYMAVDLVASLAVSAIAQSVSLLGFGASGWWQNTYLWIFLVVQAWCFLPEIMAVIEALPRYRGPIGVCAVTAAGLFGGAALAPQCTYPMVLIRSAMVGRGTGEFALAMATLILADTWHGAWIVMYLLGRVAAEMSVSLVAPSPVYNVFLLAWTSAMFVAGTALASRKEPYDL